METPAKQPTFIEKVKSAAEQKFEANKSLAIDLTNKCKAIAITDEITLAMANQVLSQANSHLKLIEDKRKELKEPYHNAGKVIDATAKEFSTPLEAGISHGKLELRKWNDEQERIKREKEEKLRKQQEFFTKMEANLLKKSDECATPEDCDKLINSINVNFPVYQKQLDLFIRESEEMKQRYLSLITMKKGLLEKAVAGGSGSTQALVDMQQKAIEQGQIAQEQMQETALKAEAIQQGINDAVVTSNVRKIWKAEIADANAIPREWLCLDMDKVNAYLKDVIRPAGEEKTVNGIRFFIDKTPMIR